MRQFGDTVAIDHFDLAVAAVHEVRRDVVRVDHTWRPAVPVDGIDARAAELAWRGVGLGEITDGGTVRFAVATDPSGNVIRLRGSHSG